MKYVSIDESFFRRKAPKIGSLVGGADLLQKRLFHFEENMGKQFGALYLILGTCVGAGLLGLPIVTSPYHLTITVAMVISAWVIMTIGAWCLLQVTMSMPRGANFISMSKNTLGNMIKVVTWFVYLLLLYTLICLYLSAGGDVLQHFLSDANITIPRALATVIVVFILGGIVMHGIHSVDWSNRVIMSVKIIICLLLIASVIPFAHGHNLSLGKMQWNNSAWLSIITAFGYATVLPTLRDYLNNDRKKLTRIVLLGSLIPMVLYFIWIIVIQGALSRHALVGMVNSPNTNSSLMSHIVMLTHHSALKMLPAIFVPLCSVTGFLGVSLCLVDFLADGTKLKKQGVQKMWLAILTFAPSTITVILDPAIFTRALAYAGACCIYILVALPVAMFIAMKIKNRRAA